MPNYYQKQLNRITIPEGADYEPVTVKFLGYNGEETKHINLNNESIPVVRDFLDKLEGGKAGHWSENEEFPMCDWKDSVLAGDTLLGYWEWVNNEKKGV